MFYSYETNFDISTKTFISTSVTSETINCKTNLENLVDFLYFSVYGIVQCRLPIRNNSFSL